MSYDSSLMATRNKILHDPNDALGELRYLELLMELVGHAEEAPEENRTEFKTGVIFGHMLKFSMENGLFPLLTTKKMPFRWIVEEALMFLRGETDSKAALEGTGINIWTGNTSKGYLENFGEADIRSYYRAGMMGPMYGYQWRFFNKPYPFSKVIDPAFIPNDNLTELLVMKNGTCQKNGHHVDQLAEAIRTLKENPTSRQIVVTAWNPLQKEEGVLPPCHILFHVNIVNGKLCLSWFQRSVDTFLGLPFNIASYAIIAQVLAKVAGVPLGQLVFMGSNVHLYANAVPNARTQILRTPLGFPRLKIKKELNSVKDIEDLVFEDFELDNYRHHPKLPKIVMAGGG